MGHYTVGAHLQTTRERGCSVACIRHGELCSGSGGTRIVRVVDCGYNNVVFKANEYLFEKILGTLVAIARLLPLSGKRVFASFRGAVMLGRRWCVVVGMVSASPKRELAPPRSPTTNGAGPSKSIECAGPPMISCRFAGFQY